MNWKAFLLILALGTACYAVDDDVDEHGIHHHGGPPPKGITLVSLGLSTGGAVIVSMTLLALLWNPIDAAFRRGRFRSQWERRSTRVGFALGVMALAGVIVGIATFAVITGSEHAEHRDEAALLQPQHGGQVMRSGRYVLEMFVRRTGELHLYVHVTEGVIPEAWQMDAKITISPQPPGPAGPTTMPLEHSPDGSYFVGILMPPKERNLGVHLSLHVLNDDIKTDFNLPVQD